MKIKYSIINKLASLGRVEMELFFYLIEKQDQNTGVVEGVYYRDAIKSTKMVKQSFYNALKGLESKEVIKITRNSKIDYDIYIVGNEFPNKESFNDGYINIRRGAFRSKKFKELKGHEKYMLLEFLKCTHENRGSMKRNVKEFYEKWKELFGVTTRVVRGYLHNLRGFFTICIIKGIYYITYRHSEFKVPYGLPSELWVAEEQLIRKECHRNKIKDISDKAIQDVTNLIKQHKDQFGSRELVKVHLMKSIEESVVDLRPKDRSLSPAYVHKILLNHLDTELEKIRSFA